MVTRFFKADKHTRIVESLNKYLDNRTKTIMLAGEYFKEKGITATEFNAVDERLYIIPSELDMENYGEDLNLKDYGSGMRLFRKNCGISQGWKRKLKEHKHKVFKFPSLGIYISPRGSKFEQEEHFIKGELYIKLTSEVDISMLDNATPILGSEYYLALESEGIGCLNE